MKKTEKGKGGGGAAAVEKMKEIPKKAVLYFHGRGGSGAEAEHYKALFPGYEVTGPDYRSETPWEAKEELKETVLAAKEKYETVLLIANSVGAYFAMTAGIEKQIEKAYFISPVVDMPGLISGMMRQAGVTEEELKKKGEILTDSGEILSWKYLSWARAHPARWRAEAEILYGKNDPLTGFETMRDFAGRNGMRLTVMENGGHWFHTEGEMRFLDEWIRRGQTR